MSKFCQYCGGEVNAGDRFCQKCGAKIEESASTVETTNTVEIPVQNNTQNFNQTNNVNAMTKTNGAAIGGFVCSIVGLIIFGIVMGILAVCLGITARRHIAVFKNEKGAGLATAAIVIGIIDIVFPILFMLIGISSIF